MGNLSEVGYQGIGIWISFGNKCENTKECEQVKNQTRAQRRG